MTEENQQGEGAGQGEGEQLPEVTAAPLTAGCHAVYAGEVGPCLDTVLSRLDACEQRLKAVEETLAGGTGEIPAA